MRISGHDPAESKAKIRRHTNVWQEFLTQLSDKSAEKTCVYAYVNRFSHIITVNKFTAIKQFSYTVLRDQSIVNKSSAAGTSAKISANVLSGLNYVLLLMVKLFYESFE